VFGGCPSSGPVVAVLGNTVAVSWTTLVNNKMILRTAFSDDKGRHFAAPIAVELENATGVIGIALENDHSSLLAWTQADANGEAIKFARVFDDGRIEHRTTAHSLGDRGTYKWQAQHMAKANDAVCIGWHDEQGKRLGLVKVLVAE
jgi:hypothetical protein